MSAKKYAPYKATLTMPVVDRTGAQVDGTRYITNAPYTAFFDEPVVAIDWLINQKTRPTKDDFSQPVVIQHDILDEDGKTVLVAKGTVFYGAYAWGSNVKKGQTYGLRFDILTETGIGRYAQDGLRVGRWMMPNFIYGAAQGTFKVMLVEPGTVIEGVGPVGDGFGYISDELEATAAETGITQRLASPGDANDSFHVTQRLPWDSEMQAESLPRIQERINEMAKNRLQYGNDGGPSVELMKKLVGLEAKMQLHPYVANSLGRAQKERAIRTATTIPMGGKVRVAVPALCKTYALPVGKYVSTRFPIDAWGSVDAAEVRQGDVTEGEVERIAKMRVVQYSFASETVAFKGAAGVVSKAALQGYDAILCKKDLKMATRGVETLQRQAKLTLTDCVFGMTMRYAEGSAVGVNLEHWEKKGGDVDGDQAVISDCANMPVLFERVSRFPEQETKKFPKANHKLAEDDRRAQQIEDSLSNLVGWATNVMANTFVYRDRDWMATQLGYKGGQLAMDKNVWYYVKCGTDLFKLDLEKMGKTRAVLEQELAQLQNAITQLTGKSAPWSKWRRDDWAFVHGIPQLWNPELGISNTDPRVANSIPVEWDGTVPMILRYTLPQIEAILQEPIDALPLVEFINWAAKQEDALMEAASKLQLWFNGRVRSVNFGWEEDVAQFRSDWTQRLNTALAALGTSRLAFAQALWRVAHSARSTNAGAASMFFAFPEEAEWIIAKKPGLAAMKGSSGFQTVILGLHPKVERITCTGKLVTYEKVAGKKRFTMKALELDGDVMKGQYAVIADNHPMPEQDQGTRFTVHIIRRSNASWFATLLER